MIFDGNTLQVVSLEAAQRKLGITSGGGDDCFALVDGGEPDTFFGEVTPLDGGGVT